MSAKIRTKKNSRIGAFFDFDSTLLSTETASLFVKYFRDNNLRFWAGKRLSLAYLLKLWIAKKLFDRHLISEVTIVSLLFKFYRGRHQAIVEEWAPFFYEEYLKSYLAPNLLERVNEHKREGHILILVSGGIRPILAPVVKNLQFDHLICSDLEVDSKGIYTGIAKGEICVDSNKRELARRFALDCDIDLAKSYSYGNHQSDIPILEMVGNPAVVEPTEPLLKIALQRKWPVLSFR